MYVIIYLLGYPSIRSVFYLNYVASIFDISQSVIDPKTG